MKKKGFTLIELLAVIVILAIIALIATPLVLKYIEKARQESKVDSAYSYVRNLETAIANFSLTNNGKKYTSGELDINSITDLDTKVKGENPEGGKVCISSVGQLEKGVFKYGKYYVSYDGKKGSIIDEATYTSFSCSETITDVMFEIDVMFSEESTDYYFGTGTINKDIYDMFIGSSEYEVVIDDNKVMSVFAISGDIYKAMTSDNILYSSNEYIILYLSKDDNQIMIETNIKLLGTHNIKISYPRETNDNTLFAIINYEDDAALGTRIILHDSDFVEGDATVLIEDEDGVVYLNQNIIFTDNDGDGIYGIDDCRDYRVSFPDLYAAIEQGKKIKITVTQNIDGIDVTSVVVDDYITKTAGYLDYYIGRIAFLIAYTC